MPLHAVVWCPAHLWAGRARLDPKPQPRHGAPRAQALKDNTPYVRDTTAWTLGCMFENLHDASSDASLQLISQEELPRVVQVRDSVNLGAPNPRAPDPRAPDLRATNPRASDPRDPNPRASDPRDPDPRASDPRAPNPRDPDPRAQPCDATSTQH